MSDTAITPTWLAKPVDQVPDFEAVPALASFRKQHWTAFLEAGLPTRANERWKYTDLSFLSNQVFTSPERVGEKKHQAVVEQCRIKHAESILLVVENGFFMPSYSDVSRLPDGVIACSLREALEKFPDKVQAAWQHSLNAIDHPFAALNAGIFVDGLFLLIPAKHCLTMPVHLLSLATDPHAFIAHPHHIVMLGEQATLTLLEEHVSLTPNAYMINTVTTVLANKDSRFHCVKMQKENTKAIHLASTFVYQQQNSKTTFTHISLGGMFAREDLSVRLTETGADCHAGGFYQLSVDNQYMDHHIDILHAAVRGQSEMLYKGILDKKSRAVFNGKLHVAKDAQKIVAYQANHNLLLSPEAEVYSKPELEIYADDVKCKHGATTGQIDQDALFYMRARGIPHKEAMALLLQGFAKEIMERVPQPCLRAHIEERML